MPGKCFPYIGLDAHKQLLRAYSTLQVFIRRQIIFPHQDKRLISAPLNDYLFIGCQIKILLHVVPQL